MKLQLSLKQCALLNSTDESTNTEQLLRHKLSTAANHKVTRKMHDSLLENIVNTVPVAHNKTDNTSAACLMPTQKHSQKVN